MATLVTMATEIIIVMEAIAMETTILPHTTQEAIIITSSPIITTAMHQILGIIVLVIISLQGIARITTAPTGIIAPATSSPILITILITIQITIQTTIQTISSLETPQTTIIAMAQTLTTSSPTIIIITITMEGTTPSITAIIAVGIIISSVIITMEEEIAISWAITIAMETICSITTIIMEEIITSSTITTITTETGTSSETTTIIMEIIFSAITITTGTFSIITMETIFSTMAIEMATYSIINPTIIPPTNSASILASLRNFIPC